jgi:hypothetical protein
MECLGKILDELSPHAIYNAPVHQVESGQIKHISKLMNHFFGRCFDDGVMDVVSM